MQGDEWVFRMEMAAIYHKFIVGSRVWAPRHPKLSKNSQSFSKFLFSFQARNKQKLEMESGCKIVVPKREELEDCVYLRARQKQQIYSCKVESRGCRLRLRRR